MQYKGTKNIAKISADFDDLAQFNIADPYIDSAKHIRAMYRRMAEYFAAYNQAVKNAHRDDPAAACRSVMFNVQQTAKTLVRLCMYQLADRRKKAADRSGKIPAAADLRLNSNAPFALSTNRVRIKNEVGCLSLGTVDNHLDRLQECGFIVKRVFKGTRANFELHIHPVFLLISDRADSRYNPQEQPIPQIRLPQNLHLFYNIKENLNNITTCGSNVQGCKKAGSGSKIFTTPPHNAIPPALSAAFAKIFVTTSERGRCPAKEGNAPDNPKLADAVRRIRELGASEDAIAKILANADKDSKKITEKNVKQCKTAPLPLMQDGIPRNCRDCTDFGLVSACKNCAGRETLKMSDLGSYWLGKDKEKWGNAGRRRDADPAYRRRFYATLLIAFAIQELFARHNLYDSEQRRSFRIILERGDVYFKGCFTTEQYEREIWRYFERIKAAKKYAENHCFSFANIYPSAYFDPDSECRCHFRHTEKWINASHYYKCSQAAMQRQRREHRFLGEIFKSLRENPSMDNFLFCEAVMRRNIPQCEKVLYQFYQALLYEYNILLKPNDNENNKTGDVPLPDGNAPP